MAPRWAALCIRCSSATPSQNEKNIQSIALTSRMWYTSDENPCRVSDTINTITSSLYPGGCQWIEANQREMPTKNTGANIEKTHSIYIHSIYMYTGKKIHYRNSKIQGSISILTPFQPFSGKHTLYTTFRRK